MPAEISAQDRWTIYIDIEGFSVLWSKENQVLLSLGELMAAIFRIGRACYPDSPERLFAHQVGDGFFIVSDFHEPSLDRCVAIAVALMRHVAATGRLAKCAIAEGQLSDIQGCYPREVTDSMEKDLTVSLKMGLMTIFPVMGTAIIRAVAMDKKAPRGPLMTIESNKRPRFSSDVPVEGLANLGLLSVDWVHMNSDAITDLQARAKLRAPTATNLEQMLRCYCSQQEVPDDWRTSVERYLHVPGLIDKASGRYFSP